MDNQTTTATTPAATGQRFKFFSGVLKAYTQKKLNDDGTEVEGAGPDYVIEGVASSNARDRYGDTMSAQCQASMLAQCSGLTMFGNHEYDVPEDVFGKCIDAKLETTGDTIDLAIKMQIASTNPRAIQAWKLISTDQIQLAFSIGGRILDADVDDENDDGSGWFPPLIINDLELLEVSLVGIPANPRAYTRSFIEDIKRSVTRAATRDDAMKVAFLRSIGVERVEWKDAEIVNAQLAHEPENKPEQDAEHEGMPSVTDDAPAAATIEGEVVASIDPEIANALVELFLEAHREECERLEVQRATLTVDINEFSTQRDALKSEVEALEQKAKDLKATPVGALSRYPNGSTHTAGTAQVDLSKLDAQELAAYTQRVLDGKVTTHPIDARASVSG